MSKNAEAFRRLHDKGQLLVLANAWDAGSAGVIQACGATAIATTSAGMAWSRGYSDGDHLPLRVLETALAEIARVLTVPLSVDVEGGYSSEPSAVAETIAAVIAAGGAGINIEDGKGSPDLLCAKIEVAKNTAARAGADLFVNARTDVYLKGLVPAERALEETLQRAAKYRAAGCDGFFVPCLAKADDIATVVAAVDLPLNLLVIPGLPSVAELRGLGVRRVSAGSSLTQGAYGFAQRSARQLLEKGTYEGVLGAGPGNPELNGLFAAVAGR